MEKVLFNGNLTSRLGYGCMRFAKVEGTEFDIDVEKSTPLLEKALSGGITYFDTAYPYHGGQSEKFIASVLSSRDRDSYYLATKMPIWEANSLDDCIRIFEEQLKNLKTDHIDYYLIHALNKDRFEKVKEFKLYEYLLEQKEQGRIKNLGFSFHDHPTVLKEIISTYKFDFAQIQLNVIDWTLQSADKQYQILTEAGIPIVVMEPLRGGRLVQNELTNGVDITSLLFRYVASLENVHVILSGMSNLEQVEENIKTFSHLEPLNEEEKKTLDMFKTRFFESRVVPCTKCEYCQPCTKDIKIPALFESFNNYLLTKDKDRFITTMASFETSARSCIKCQKCIKACPQHIDIIKKLEECDSTYRYLANTKV